MGDTRTSAKLAGLLLALLLTGACTDNPLEDSTPVQRSQRQVSGTVRLSDRGDCSGAYIWLDGFDLSTASRADGSFSLTLPPVSAQSTPGGSEGVFRVHAFLGNYRLVRVPVPVHQGLFAFPSDAVNESGQIREELFLQQLFSISTALSRSRIEADSPRVITLTVTLQSPIPPVEVFYPRMVAGIEGPVLLHNLRTGEVDIYRTTVTGVEVSDYLELGPVPYARSMILSIPKYRLRAGEYEIIPYLLPRGTDVPLSLLAGLGEDVSALGPEYVFYPFLRDGGRLIVDPN